MDFNVGSRCIDRRDHDVDPGPFNQPFSDARCEKQTFGLETFDEQEGLPKGTVRAAVNLLAPAVTLALPQVTLLTLNIGMQVAVCQVPNPTPGTPGTINDNAVVTDTSEPYPVYGWLSYD